MKGAFVLSAILAIAAASPSMDDYLRLNKRTHCSRKEYIGCCIEVGPDYPYQDEDDCEDCICPPKPAPTTPKPAPTTTTTTTTSRAPAPSGAPGSCAAAGNGATLGGYKISCGTDFPGGDIGNAPAGSFSGCTALCDKRPGCLGFSFTGGNNAGQCYFKGSQGSSVANPNVDSGFRPTPNTPGNPTTTVAPPATTPATTSPAATPSSACDALASNPPTGYTVTCRTDRPGNDLSNAPSSSFSGCIAQCNALAACAGFSYVGGSGAGVCYFKSALGATNKNGQVDFAAKNNFTPPATTTTTPPKPEYTCLCPAVRF